MFRSLFLAILPVTLGSMPVLAQLPTLRDRVTAQGRDLMQELRPNYPVPDFQTLVIEADTIVVATVEYGVPVLTHQDSLLQTDYHVTVQQVVRRTVSPALVPGDKLVVRRLGGVTRIEGFNVSMIDPDFPGFSAGETYVLFLTSEPGDPYPTFRYGGQDAFRVMADNKVKQASVSRDTWNRERGLVSLPPFLDEVRKVIAAAR